MLASGSHWVVALLFANTFLCFFIAIYSVIRRVGVWSSSVYDFVFFGMGILGLVLWQLLDAPIIVLILAIIADLSFGIPTIIKTYKNPESGSYWPEYNDILKDIFLNPVEVDGFKFANLKAVENWKREMLRKYNRQKDKDYLIKIQEFKKRQA